MYGQSHCHTHDFLLFASDSGFLPHFFKMFWSNRGAWHNIRGMGVCRINEKLSLIDVRQPFLSNFYDFLHFERFPRFKNTILCKFADEIPKKKEKVKESPGRSYNLSGVCLRSEPVSSLVNSSLVNSSLVSFKSGRFKFLLSYKLSSLLLFRGQLWKPACRYPHP